MWSCDFRFHGESYGGEAQMLRDGELVAGQRFVLRELVQVVGGGRAGILEKGASWTQRRLPMFGGWGRAVNSRSGLAGSHALHHAIHFPVAIPRTAEPVRYALTSRSSSIRHILRCTGSLTSVVDSRTSRHARGVSAEEAQI
jgi:hypothetical protein